MYRLLWGTVWRGGAYGLGLGAALGALYGVLLPLTTSLVEAGVRPAEMSRLAGGVGQSLVFVAGLIPFGLLYGAACGAAVGVLLGLVTGLVVGVVTPLWPASAAGGPAYRCAIGVLGALVTVLVGGPLFAQLRFRPGWTDSASVDYVLFSGLPLLIAGLVQQRVALRVARWHLRTRVVLLPPDSPEGDSPRLAYRRGALLGPVLPPVLLAAGILASAAATAAESSRTSPPPAPFPITVASLSRPPEMGPNDTIYALAWLAGTNLLVADVQVTSAGERTDRRQLYVVDPGRDEARPLPLPDDPRCRFTTRRLPQGLADGRVAFVQGCVLPHAQAARANPFLPSGNTMLVAADPHDATVRQLLPYPLPDDTQALSLTPDGQQGIAKEGGGVTERFWQLGPEHAERLTVPVRCTGHPTISPTGQAIALTALTGGAADCAQSADGALYLLPLADSAPAVLAEGFANHLELGPPTWSPDGRWLALVVPVPWERPHGGKQERSELWLVDIASREWYRLLPPGWRVRLPTWSSDGRRLAFVGADRSPTAPGDGAPPPTIHIIALSELPTSASL